MASERRHSDTPDSTDESDSTEVPPAREPAPTPLVSAAQLSQSQYPWQRIGEERFYTLGEHASRIASTTDWSSDDHLQGLLGEDAVAHHLGIHDRLDTQVYADGGDGGVDLEYRGATIDVKTVGRHRPDPALTVDTYEPLTADYYALASRIGKTNCCLVGYAPREFVANAPKREHQRTEYHYVDQRYLFPFPQVIR